MAPISRSLPSAGAPKASRISYRPRSVVLSRCSAPLAQVENIEIRLHGTILYNSIYRSGDQLLVNTHIYGTMANNAPVFHLRKIPGGSMVSSYVESFEHVWDVAKPYEEK